eukprot:g24294.t1
MCRKSKRARNIVGRAETKEEFEWAMNKAKEMYDYIHEEFERKFSYQGAARKRDENLRAARCFNLLHTRHFRLDNPCYICYLHIFHNLHFCIPSNLHLSVHLIIHSFCFQLSHRKKGNK